MSDEFQTFYKKNSSNKEDASLTILPSNCGEKEENSLLKAEPLMATGGDTYLADKISFTRV